MSTQWSGSTPVNTTNLNKAVMGDGSTSGLQALGVRIISDGLGNGVGSFTFLGPASSLFSVVSYTSDVLEVSISGKTLAYENTSATCNLISTGVAIGRTYIDSNNLKISLRAFDGSLYDWDDNGVSVFVIVLTSD